MFSTEWGSNSHSSAPAHPSSLTFRDIATKTPIARPHLARPTGTLDPEGGAPEEQAGSPSCWDPSREPPGRTRLPLVRTLGIYHLNPCHQLLQPTSDTVSKREKMCAQGYMLQPSF